ncbi:hypothetical protein C8Q80DRAFT_568211 [Daedaleopsis nitida]|nr:hypothetical protein C8Q80DRAFT_568211 [Daedaleopsis nitida]
MSKPAIVPETSAAGIAVDPRTLERVIPESRRPDGTVRKQIKIRPGYTPQEDVRRFRGTRQAQMDVTSLPKGHIIGWTPSAQAAAASKAGMSKAQKKNEKRKEKRKEKKEDEKVKDNWDDDDEPEAGEAAPAAKSAEPAAKHDGAHTGEKSNWAVAPDSEGDGGEDALADKLEKLEVR